MTDLQQQSKPREYSIRVGAKAVIVRDDMILLVKYDDENGHITTALAEDT